MGEKDLVALEQYDITVLRTGKGREAMLCETNNGLMLLKEYSGTEERIEAEAGLLDRLSVKKVKTDSYVRNKEGKVVTTTSDNKRYYLKNWPEGQEIDIKSNAGADLAVRTLAILHNGLNEVAEEIDEACFLQGRSFEDDMIRHQKELKHIRGFIRAKRRKTDFELKVLECFDLFYEQGIRALEYTESEAYTECIKEGIGENGRKTLCHGNYNQHNILVNNRNVTVTNFDKVAYNLQITDLYLLMRKCMEKQNWNTELGLRMVTEYDKIKKISRMEKTVLYALLLYPEKFWKIVNYYYNRNKSWVSQKSIGKLQALIELESRRQNFLEELQRL